MLVIGRERPRAVRRAVSGTIGRPIFGRATDYGVRSAHCPVLIAQGDGGVVHAQNQAAEEPEPVR